MVESFARFARRQTRVKETNIRDPVKPGKGQKLYIVNPPLAAFTFRDKRLWSTEILSSLLLRQACVDSGLTQSVSEATVSVGIVDLSKQAAGRSIQESKGLFDAAGGYPK